MDLNLEVGCPGSPYPTIQAAIDAASNGDVVRVCNGTYFERLMISGKELTLRSLNGSGSTVVDAERWGRALSITDGASVTVDGFTFANGATADVGADVYCSRSTLRLTDSTLAAGTAGNGGGLGAEDCTGQVRGVTFDSNSSWSGGGAWVVGGAVDLRSNTFIRNEAVYAGGGLYLTGSSALVDNTIQANASGWFGGGAYVDIGWGEIDGNFVADNITVNDGGGIYVSEGGPVLSDNTFERNEAGDEGGGLRIKLSDAVVLDNTFDSNRADMVGGGMKVSHAPISMRGNTFTANSSGVAGGGLHLEESASTVTDSTFEANTSAAGGAVHIEHGWAPVVFEDGLFVGNSATGSGGAFYVAAPEASTVLRRLDLRDGLASDGGALYTVGSEVVVENCVIADNVATSAGGGLFYETSTGAITNVVVVGNSAGGGSGLFVSGTTDALAVSNAVFAMNLSSAAVTVDSGTAPIVRYSDFHQNTEDFSGVDVDLDDGSFSASPGFSDQAGGDFTLLSDSALVDAGDPAILDADGTRSDIGRYGGLGAY